jgi:GT2 family glycosyltransferase
MACDVSVVIPTCNRRGILSRVLDALGRQELPLDRFEVVVVDDGSTDGTPEFVQQLRAGFRLRLVRQQNSGPAVARNAGVAASAATLLLFLDDDLVPEPQLLLQHLASHADGARVAVVGPLGSLPHYPQPWVAWQQEQVEKQYRAMERGDFAPTFRQFWTANCSLRRAEFDAVGGFDARLRRNEDVELGWRLAQNGVGFRFNPAALGYHHATRSLRSWVAAHGAYGDLEVEIFGRAGPRSARKMFAETWQGLHFGTRTLIRIGKPAPVRAAASLALRAAILAGLLPPLFRVSQAACSAYANLHYWENVRARVGEDEFASIRDAAAHPAPSSSSAEG